MNVEKQGEYLKSLVMQRNATMKTSTAPKQAAAPQVGMLFRVYGQQCRITRVLPFGTIDVETLDGERNYRVTGLPMWEQS